MTKILSIFRHYGSSLRFLDAAIWKSQAALFHFSLDRIDVKIPPVNGARLKFGINAFRAVNISVERITKKK